MLCVWWDQKAIIYYELLKPKQTVNANLYSQQLTLCRKNDLFHAMVSKRTFCYMTTLDHMLLKQLRKGKRTWAGNFYHTRRIPLTQLHPITTCSDRCSIYSRRKFTRKLKVSKKTSIRIFPPDQEAFTRDEYNLCEKDGRRSY